MALLQGTGQFVDEHTVVVGAGPGQVSGGSAPTRSSIATGTRPARPATVMFDDVHIFDSDGILGLREIPRTLVIVGAGVIGIEYASIFAALGTKVTVIEQRDRMLEFCDEEVVEALQFHLRSLAVTFRFRETVEAVETHEGGTVTTLASGKVGCCRRRHVLGGPAGRDGWSGLRGHRDRAGQAGPHKSGRAISAPTVDHIYAVGDVIGFPALASTSMEQGRLAAYPRLRRTHRLHAIGAMPIGIYTIPEMSYVGQTEAQLTDASVPYEVGVSRYRELARGQICGDSVRHAQAPRFAVDRKVLGVHLFGTGATEIVHIGQAVMGCGGTVDYLTRRRFQLPDAGGGLQSGRPRRHQQATRRGAPASLKLGSSPRRLVPWSVLQAPL